MSNNTIIPKEQLTAYQRWELAAFDDAGSDAQAEEAAGQRRSQHEDHAAQRGAAEARPQVVPALLPARIWRHRLPRARLR